jgi:uncharacterized protein YjbJ (UPF0337 family)
METSKNVMNGKWMEIKGDIQKAWGTITNDELEKTKGDLKSIRGLIQQKNGGSEESYAKKLDGIMEKYPEYPEKKETIITTGKEQPRDQKADHQEQPRDQKANHQDQKMDQKASHQEQPRDQKANSQERPRDQKANSQEQPRA